MKHINKQPAPSVWEAEIKKLGEAERADWGNLSAAARGALKAALLEEQGHICCYCGARIFFNHNIRLEHLRPREHHKDLVFAYRNLLASCAGGGKDRVHMVQAGDTQEDICSTYSLSLEELLDFNPGKDPFQLQLGEKWIVDQGGNPPETHCDKHKGDQEISIHPLMGNCEHYFWYDSLTGEVIPRAGQGSLEAARVNAVITTLGLNAHSLIRQRKQATLSIWAVLEVESMSIHEISQYITALYQIGGGALIPYCQVIAALLRQELIFRRRMAS